MAEGSELSRINATEMSAGGEDFKLLGLNPVQIKGVAQAMALSGMFPDIQKDSAKAFVKIMAGQEMGIAPFQAMSDISIISGKAAPGGNLHASKVKSSGKYDYRVRKWDNTICEIEFFEVDRKGNKESLGISSFGEEDAKNAQLLTNANYKKYPRNMFFNRAMTNGVRTLCPDVLNGIAAYTPEELGAEVDGDGRVLRLPDQPAAPVSSAAPAANDQPAKPAKPPVIEGETIAAPPKPAAPKKSVIEQIGDALKEKGFTEEVDRKAIALALAGVDRPGAASPEQWAEVLENIKAMNGEELAGYLDATSGDEIIQEDSEEDAPAAPTQGDDTPVTDDDIAALDAQQPEKAPEPAVVLPVYEKGSSSLPRPEMRTKVGELFKMLDLNTKVAQQNFTVTAIGKKIPATFDDFDMLLGFMANEINTAAAEKANQGELISE